MAFATARDRYTDQEIERFYAEGLWRPETIFDVLEQQVAVRPDKLFVSDGTTSYTYRQLRDAALGLATGLVRRGIRPRERVAVQIPNWTEFAVIAVALGRIGAIMVPIMPIYRHSDVGHVVDTAGVRAVFTAGTFRGFDHAAMFRDLTRTSDSLTDVIVLRSDDVPDGALRYADVVVDVGPQTAAAEIGPGVGPDDPFIIVFSSGTTSRAKGCLHTFNTEAAGARLLGQAFRYTEDDVQFGPSPITHTTGLVTSLLLPMLNGAGSHLMEVWEPREGLERIAKFRCTASVTATTFLQMLVDVYDPDVHDASSMRFWTCAGAPIPGPFVEAARRALPSMQVLSLYGRSENLTTTVCTVDDDPQRSITSDGRALPGSIVQVVDPVGNAVAPGVEGDIAYRGASLLLEYINQPEETAAMFTAAGLSLSGDLGVMDADGYVRVTGRIKDIVIRGGLNISVREVEDLLTTHPSIAAAAAVGMPDPILGERVCLYLVSAAGAPHLTLEEIKQYLLGAGLAIQKVPERVEFVDALPMTPTGKIQKNLLRADIAGKLAR
jgi:acyl-CoA synthetase (AMP-forming)/AMP-acid ligase II